MLENRIGVVCSVEKGQVYCLENSQYRKQHEFELRSADVFLIPMSAVHDLIARYGGPSQWVIEDVLKFVE